MSRPEANLEEDNPFLRAGEDVPKIENVIQLEDRRNTEPHDRLPTNRFFGSPPLKSLYHTERAEAARQRAQSEVPDELAEAGQTLLDAGLLRSNPDYADVADHNAMTLAYALRYQTCGLHVVDSHAIDPATGEGTGKQAGTTTAKTPRGAAWQDRASNNREEIIQFWTGDGEYPPNKQGETYPYARVNAPRNVSISFPEGCGLFVLDIDGEEGKAALAALEAKHGVLPRTAKSVSGSGGWHFIFKGRPAIYNTASAIATGVDIRGEGGQIIAAPSIHKSGNFYQWEVTPWDCIADAPEWLDELAFNATKSRQDKPKRESSNKSKSGRRSESKKARVSETAGFDNFLSEIGDHEGGGGFDTPIYRAACSWFSTHGIDDDSSELFNALRDRIGTAYRDPERDRSKYDTDEYLDRRIEQASEFISAQRSDDSTHEGRGEVADPSGIVTANPLDSVYDERLVDSLGFLRRPEDAPSLYKEMGVAPSKPGPEAADRAYARMVGVVRGQIVDSMRMRFSYVVTPDGAKAAILTAKGASPVFYSEAALDRLFRNREVSYVNEEGKLKKLQPHVLFFYDRERATFDGTCFEPNASAAPAHKFNIWTGFAVEPVKGDWSLLRNHVRDVLCEGDDDLFHWFMTWIASPFARPGVKVPSSVAIRGEQGTGKSKLFDWLRDGMGCAALKVSQGKHLTGSFNAHLDGKLLLVCEEAFWAGDRAAAGVIKDLITADELTVEAKFENAVTRPNRLAVAFISNNDWIIPTDGKDARRFLVLEASNAHKEDAAYFKAIDKQMREGGLEAMVYDLVNWDPAEIGGWDVLRRPPKTDGLRQQARMGLNGPMAELIGIIEEGILSGKTADGDAFYYDLSDDEPTRVARSHVNAVLGIKKGRGNETVAGREALEKLIGDEANHRNKDVIHYRGEMSDGSRVAKQTDSRVLYVEFPPLDELRVELAEFGEDR